jgi:hypothetical protein
MKQTDEQILQEAMAEYESNLRGKIAEYRKIDDREELTLDSIETMWGLAREAGDEVLREVYEKLVESSGEGKIVKKKEAELKGQGITVRNKGKVELSIQTTNGTLTMRRTVLQIQTPPKEDKKGEDKKNETTENAAQEGTSERREKQAEIIPLDEYLKIDSLPFRMSRECMVKVTKYGQLMEYKDAEELLKDDQGIKVTDTLINEVTNYVGKIVFEGDRERAEKIDKNRAKNTPCGMGVKRKGVFYALFDGSMLNIRAWDEQGHGWHEMKLALLFPASALRPRRDKKGEYVRDEVSGEIKYDITEKEYVCYLGGTEEFEKYVYEAATRMGCFEYEKIVVVSDGAAWIRNMADRVFDGCVQILDFYHLCENIGNFGKYLFRKKREDERAVLVKGWADPLIAKMREGKVKEVLGELIKYKGKTYAGVVNPYTYLKNNEDKVAYKEYREAGYYIGSGPIESANKTVIQSRMKQGGMHWDRINAQYVGTLRTKWKSGSWDRNVRESVLAA